MVIFLSLTMGIRRINVEFECSYLSRDLRRKPGPHPVTPVTIDSNPSSQSKARIEASPARIGAADALA